jgi:multiple sugar transport system permease protein
VRGRTWLLAVPLVAYLGLVLVYPTVYAVKLAFTDTVAGRFPSVENLRLLAADPLFWRAVRNNVLVPAASVAVELVSGLGLALLLAARLPARRWLRATVVIPFALPEIVLLTIMRNVLVERGYANGALLTVGLGPVAWLRPGSATAFLAVVAVDAWHMTPVVFLMLLAALAAIPAEIDEAARLDGAGGLRRLRHVTLPLLRPALAAAVLLRGLDALRIFATPLVLTGVDGVPVLSSYAYHQWADQGNDGAAAAASLALALVSVALSVPLLARRRAA